MKKVIRMDKKIGIIIGIIAVVIVAVIGIAFISGGTTATVGNETFNIPNGFSEVNSTNKTNGVGKVFQNENNETILILIIPLSDQQLNMHPNNGEVNKTVNGISGLYSTQRFTSGVYAGSYFTFRYVHDHNGIRVLASDEGLIEQVVK